MSDTMNIDVTIINDKALPLKNSETEEKERKKIKNKTKQTKKNSKNLC